MTPEAEGIEQADEAGTASSATTSRAPTPTYRSYEDDRDWWRIRALLVETLPRTPPGFNWNIRHWDGQRYHRAEPATEERLASQIAVWESGDGRLVGAVHPEGRGDAWIEIDPDFRHLEPEMIEWAEAHLALVTSEGRTLEFTVLDDDHLRRRLLADRGYTPDLDGGWERWIRLESSAPVEPPGLVPPYLLRSTDRSAEDCARMADLLNAGFGRTGHSAVEIHNFVTRSPSFEHELDLVAVAPDGSFAATVGATYDRSNRHGTIEPVCTHPDHRRLGLARGLLIEGLARLRARGALSAGLDTGEREAANALYIGCGFVEGYHFRSWRKAL